MGVGRKKRGDVRYSEKKPLNLNDSLLIEILDKKMNDLGAKLTIIHIH
jgi:hypothetical protein